MFGLSFQDRINKPNRLLSKIVNEPSAGEVDVNGPSLIVTNPDPVVRVPHAIGETNNSESSQRFLNSFGLIGEIKSFGENQQMIDCRVVTIDHLLELGKEGVKHCRHYESALCREFTNWRPLSTVV